MNRPVKLLIADHTATCAALRAALEDSCEICAEAESAPLAITAAERTHPDVCLIGSELPGGTLDAIRGIREAAPDAAVLVLSETQDVDHLLAVIRAGAIGYVSAASQPAVLRRIVVKVADGEAVVPRALMRDLVHELQGTVPGARGVTAREAQVLGMVRRGQSTAAIAERLEISPVTVRRHISALMHKVGAESRSGLSLDRAALRTQASKPARR